MSSSKGSSYTAFRDVDDLVSKPVMGSDGSASWQEFSKKNPRKDGPSVAPALPMKRAAKLGTGFATLEQERLHENKMREQAGDAPLGSGYTDFKRKVDPNQLAEKKRNKMIMDRIRPDNIIYFIAADTFQGWKEDYVFTTRDRGTGYYWDGNDGRNKLLNQNKDSDAKHSEETLAIHQKRPRKTTSILTSDTQAAPPQNVVVEAPIQTLTTPTSVLSNARDLVNQVIQDHQRNIATPGTRPSSSRLAMAQLDQAILSGTISLTQTISKDKDKSNIHQEKNWETAKDPASGRDYYFCRATGESTWDKPSSL